MDSSETFLCTGRNFVRVLGETFANYSLVMDGFDIPSFQPEGTAVHRKVRVQVISSKGLEEEGDAVIMSTVSFDKDNDVWLYSYATITDDSYRITKRSYRASDYLTLENYTKSGSWQEILVEEIKPDIIEAK